MPERHPSGPPEDETQIPKSDNLDPSESQPETQEEPNDERLNLLFVGVSQRSFRAHALEEANRRYNVATSGEGFVGVLRSLKHGEFSKIPGKATEAFKQSIKGGVGREVTLGYQLSNATEEIKKSQNLKIHEGGEAADYEESLLYRFGEAADKYEEVVQEAAGEKRLKFSLDMSEEEGPISPEVKGELRDLLTYATRGDFDRDDGTFNKQAFNEAVKDFEVRTAKDPEAAPYLNSSALRVNNMYQMVLALRSRLDVIVATNPQADDETLDDLFNGVLNQTDVVFGEAHVGSFAESGRTMREKIEDKLSRVPYLNPDSVAVAAGMVLAVGQWSRRRALTATTAAAAGAAIGGAPLLATAAAIGITGAALGALRGATSARQEHILRARRHARGEHDPLDGVGLYESETYTEATDKLNLLYDSEGNLRQGDLATTMSVYAQEAARLRLSIIHKNGDLLVEDTNHPRGIKQADQFSDFTVALSKVKADLREVLDEAIDTGDIKTLNALGIKEDMRDELWNAQDPLETILESLISGNTGVLELDVLGEIKEDMQVKEQAQKQVARSSTISGLAKGATASLISMAIGQSLEAGRSENITGIASAAFTKVQELITGNHLETMQEMPSTKTWIFSANSSVGSPEGFTFNTDQEGGYTLTGSNGMRIEGLHIQANGALSDDSIKLLQEHGINTTIDFQTNQETVAAQTTTVDATKFIETAENNNVKVYTNVDRNWEDNGTPGADYNEQRLGSPYMEKDGTIAIDLSRLEVEPGAKVEAAFTVSTSTGDQMLAVSRDDDGIVRIHPTDGDLYNNFKQTDDGLRFVGEWTQATIDRGETPAGHQIDVLATDIGLQEDTFTVQTPEHTVQSTSAMNTLHYSIPKPETSQVVWNGVGMPVSVRVRRGLNLPPTEATPLPPPPTPAPAPTPRQSPFAFNEPGRPRSIPRPKPTVAATEATPQTVAAPNTTAPTPEATSQANTPPHPRKTGKKAVPSATIAAPQPKRVFPEKKQRGGKRRERAAAAAAAATAAASTTEPEAEAPEALFSPAPESIASESREEVRLQATPTPVVVTTPQDQNVSDSEETSPATEPRTTEGAEASPPAPEASTSFSPVDLASRLSRARQATPQYPPATQNPPEQTASVTTTTDTAQSSAQQPEGVSAPSAPGIQPGPQTFAATPVSTTTTSVSAAPTTAQTTKTEEAPAPAAPVQTAAQPATNVQVPPRTNQTPPSAETQPRTPSKALTFIVPPADFGRPPQATASSAPISPEHLETARRVMETKTLEQADVEKAELEAAYARRTAEANAREAELLAERTQRAEALINGQVGKEFTLRAQTLPGGQDRQEQTSALRMVERAIQEVAADYPDLTPTAIFGQRNDQQTIDARLRRLHKLVTSKIHVDRFKGVQPRFARVIDEASKWWLSNEPENLEFSAYPRRAPQTDLAALVNKLFADLFGDNDKNRRIF